jgi:TolB protein
MRRAALFLLVTLGAASASAQAPAPAAGADDISVVVRDGVQRIVLDVPRFPGDDASDAVLRRVIRDDLFFSGQFEFVPEGAAAPYRLEGTIEPAAKLAITYALRNTADGTVLAAKRYTGSAESIRRIAHKIAEDVLRAFTGSGGAFDTRIAFASDSGDRRDIYVMDYDGANVSRVTNDGAIVLSPEVSPDGQLLIFTSYVGRLPSVYVVRRDTGDIRKLMSREGLNQSPSFAPDGRRIAFSATFEGNSEIYASDLTGGGMARLTRGEAIDVSPSWSPSGQEIAFCSDRGGTPQIYVMTSDGLDAHRVSHEGAYNTDPAYSPDGTSLAYASRQNGRFQICVLDLASPTQKVTTITDGRANNESPSWSPDGQFLAFSSDRDGKYDVWVMRKDGTGARRVGTRGVNKFPFWYR